MDNCPNSLIYIMDIDVQLRTQCARGKIHWRIFFVIFIYGLVHHDDRDYV